MKMNQVRERHTTTHITFETKILEIYYAVSIRVDHRVIDGYNTYNRVTWRNIYLALLTNEGWTSLYVPIHLLFTDYEDEYFEKEWDNDSDSDWENEIAEDVIMDYEFDEDDDDDLLPPNPFDFDKPAPAA
jgi:hypothetical protein